MHERRRCMILPQLQLVRVVRVDVSTEDMIRGSGTYDLLPASHEALLYPPSPDPIPSSHRALTQIDASALHIPLYEHPKVLPQPRKHLQQPERTIGARNIPFLKLSFVR